MAAALAAGFAWADVSASARVECALDFAPAEGWVRPPERPLRDEVCLNGSWRFQPVDVPAGFERGGGTPPELPAPRADGWNATPIRIPSPWNVNTWGGGRDVGEGTARPYWPDSVYFPEYPAAWDRAEMGWLQRSFRVPDGWAGRRIVLHFEAVAGECRVLVNGREAGANFDSYLPFELDITDVVRRGGDNALLVGVRARSLFDLQSARYPRMRAPYPCGSDTARLAGIWPDVFLLGLPPVRVDEVLVRPDVAAGTLGCDVIVRNDSPAGRTVTLGGAVHPWVNLVGTNILDAPVPTGRLDPLVLTLPPVSVQVAPGALATQRLSVAAGGRLKEWSPDAPNLCAVVLSVDEGGQVVDRRMERFGWRQFTIAGREVRLNGRPIRLAGDFLHPFGPLVMSRRHVGAWYRMIRDFGGNAVRPHAQPHPRHFLDLADEMGMVVLDETAIFGSSIALNFEAPVAWERFAAHVDGLVRRDRNHPSVAGWSFGNELFAIFEHNRVPTEVGDDWYARLTALGRRALALDPTREWISCDGDEDLRGTLPVWSKHFGHGTPLDRLPNIEKPLMVGESGGTYYARPRQLAEFNGARAYESYAGRNEALAIDVYDNIVRMARPRLAWYSASETAWFGVEHLGFGWRDRARVPGPSDGVFFTKPFEEGRPGWQPARLPPFVATLNPGWDPTLPLYKPLAMFEAQKAALMPSNGRESATPDRPDRMTGSTGWNRGGPTPNPAEETSGSCSSPRRHPVHPVILSVSSSRFDRVGFAGDTNGVVARRLRSLGVPLAEGAPARGLCILDADSLSGPAWARAKAVLDAVSSDGGVALVLVGGAPVPDGLLPAALRVTERNATMLVPDGDHPWTAPFALPDLYFAEDGAERIIQRRGIDGPVLDGARVLLRGSDTDWSLFNEAPEHSKCAAVVLYEQMEKPSGAALIERPHGRGRLLVCSLDPRLASRPAATFWRRLLSNAGVQLAEASDGIQPAVDDHGVLINALALGRIAAADLDAAVAAPVPGLAGAKPVAGLRAGGREWRAVTCPSRDRFVVEQMGLSGPEAGAFAVDFSFWLRSPRSLDDLLADGPDAPRLTIFCYASEACRLFVGGREVEPSASEPADYRTRLTFDGVPLKKDWNHVVIRLASRHLRGATPATLAVRLRASSESYLRQIESAVEARQAAAP